jgi:hypothetical protein
MTLRELKTIVDIHLKDCPEWKEHEVMVMVSEKSMPARAMVKVSSAHPGIDWEDGRFIITPEERLVRKKP